VPEPITTRPGRRYAAPLFLASVAVHGALLVGLVVAGLWRIERLVPDATTVEVHITAPVVMAAGGDAPEAAAPRPRAVRPRARRAPRTSPIRPAPSPAPPIEPTVVAVPEAEVGAFVDEAAPVVAPGAESTVIGDAPASVGSVVESLRIAGETQILPPMRVRTAMTVAGTHRVRGVVRICLDAGGSVASSRVLRSTGHRDYDAKLLAAVAAWRYRPYTVGGRAVPVCGVVSFVYVQI
jgi:TonB family protein